MRTRLWQIADQRALTVAIARSPLPTTPRLVQRVHHFTEDVELHLGMRRVADSGRIAVADESVVVEPIAHSNAMAVFTSSW